MPEPFDVETLAVLLAAGAGSRYLGPTHKLRAPLGGRRVLEASLDHVVSAAIGPVVVVTGAADVDDIVAAASARAPEGTSVTPIHHAGWAEGQATSLQVAVAHAARLGARSIVVGLADQPFVEAAAWRAVAACPAPIAVATYDGRRRNPVRLDRTVWPLLPVSGDEGARAVMRMRPDLVEEVPCPGSPDDIDTQEDLRHGRTDRQ